MQRCITLAKKGLGYTYPNPMVGAVVVIEGNIVGEGWHQKSGTAHAEVHALATLQQSHLKKATLYVNLEPCAHHGKTPPCCDLVIAKGIKKVVVGAEDPNPKVAGKGIKAMREAGIEVIVGVMQDACIELNKRFYCYHIHKRPYIVLKWAQSQDGFMAPKNDVKGKVTWISDVHSQQLAHRWRAEEHAILIGRKTVEADNPELTTRKWNGTNPIRLVFDPTLKIQENTNVFNSAAQSIIFNELLDKKKGNVFWKKIDEENKLMSFLEKAHEHGIQSILVEGGAVTLQHFLGTNMWDECRVIISQKKLKGGVMAPEIPKGKKEEKMIVGDCLHLIKR